MKKIIWFVIPVLFLASCGEYSYPKNEKLSDLNGALVDSTASYLLTDTQFDGKQYAFTWGSTQPYVDELYRFVHEPLLHNYYLGRNIYRIVLSTSSKDDGYKTDLILSITKEKDKYRLVSKQVYFANVIAQAHDPRMERADRLYSRELTQEEADKFVSKWKDTNFYLLENDETDRNYDDFCLIEAHENNKYWTVYRSLNDASIKDISQYIKSLSGF